jgi:hypothetical protein
MLCANAGMDHSRRRDVFCFRLCLFSRTKALAFALRRSSIGRQEMSPSCCVCPGDFIGICMSLESADDLTIFLNHLQCEHSLAAIQLWCRETLINHLLPRGLAQDEGRRDRETVPKMSAPP